jgi:hypothetical protein
MQKHTLMALIHAVAVIWLAAAPALAQEDKLTYVLKRAEITPDVNPVNTTLTCGGAANPNCVEVLFGKSIPEDEAAGAVGNWSVVAIDENNQTREFTPAEVGVNRQDKLVVLKMGQSFGAGGALNPVTHRVLIRYLQHNFPSVLLGEFEKKDAKEMFTAAKGKKDADIYFSGLATGQRKSGPLYSIDAKAGYLHSLGRGGAIGGTSTFVTEEESDIDPDSITAAGTYEKIFVLSSPTGIILNSEFVGFELDKKGTTRNLTTEIDGTLVLPSARLGKSTFATVDFMAGAEAGHNYEHPLNPKGLGNFWRPKFGVNAYLLALNPRIFNRINLSANYIGRLPRSAEPFTEKINGEKMTFLTKRPRHHVGADLDLMFAPSYGVNIKYRYGSLPPAFNLVEHKVSFGFVLQLKQANR